MGSGTIGAATEREHGIVGVMSYVCVHQCSACLAENFGLRQLQQLATISRPLLFCRTTIPGQVRRFGFKSFRQNIRVFLHNFVYISSCPRIVTFACQGICIPYSCTVWLHLTFMWVSLPGGFWEWRLLIDDVERIVVIPGVSKEIESADTGVESGNFNQCAEIDLEIRIAIVPSSIRVEARQTGYPLIVTIIHPGGSHRQFAIRSKRSHIQDTESHLPNMVISNTVF